jgi:CRP-like cAMP-binding protein
MPISPEPQHGYWLRLTREQRATLIATGSRTWVGPGTPVIPEQDRSGDVSVIWSGLTKAVTRIGDGPAMVLALRGPGDIIGELAIIRHGPRSAAVVAVTRVEVLTITRDHFIRFLRVHPEAAAILHRTVVDRLCEADRDRLASASMTVGQRLARLLLKLVQRYGVPTPAGGLKVDQLSQRELAACIGGARRTVAREMRSWRQRQIITTERRTVTVHDTGALERIAGRHAPPP